MFQKRTQSKSDDPICFPQILGELSDEACALTLAISGVSAPQHLVGGGLEKGRQGQRMGIPKVKMGSLGL